MTTEQLVEKLLGNLHSAFSRTDETLLGYMQAYASEVYEAGNRIHDAIDQMSVATADMEWLDYWGDYFGVPRTANESDDDYRIRIIVEVLRPRQNNIAISMAIKSICKLDVDVVDALDEPMFPIIYYDGSETYGSGEDPNFHGCGGYPPLLDDGDDGFLAMLYDGEEHYNAETNYYDYKNWPKYCLFDINFDGYNFETSADAIIYFALMLATVERFRAGGTQLRGITLYMNGLVDQFDCPTSDASTMTVTAINRYGGTNAHTGLDQYHDGMLDYSGESAFDESMS